jgi:hypothetical protein
MMASVTTILIPWAETLVPHVDFGQYVGQYVEVDGRRYTISEAKEWWGEGTAMIELRCLEADND